MNDTTVSVNLSLLVNFKNILNITAQRGAYKAEEFKSIGVVYDQITGIITSSLPETTEEVAATSPPPPNTRSSSPPPTNTRSSSPPPTNTSSPTKDI